MSGVLTGALGALNALTSWRNNLRPSSFRGVPFHVDESGGNGGRRHVVNEYAQRDIPYIEDLGKAANRYYVRAFVVGDTYLQNSDALLAALQDDDTPAIFVHPWRGEIMCRAGLISWRESKDRGGYCSFDIDFVVDNGGLPSPIAQIDTVSTLLAGIASMLSLATAAYVTASLVIAHPALLLSLAGSLFGLAGDGLLALPADIIMGLTQQAATVGADPGNDTASATSIQAVFQGAAQNAILAAAPVPQIDDPIIGLSPLLAPNADPSAGLAGLTTWGNTLAVPANPIQAAQQAAIQALVQGQAVLATLTVYASIDWPSSNAAAAARVQVQAMVDTQLDLAAAQGQDDLYRGWQALGAQAMNDLIVRAQALPSLVGYTTLASLPAPVLAWRWYRDAGRADQIDLLNDVPDPMFMPLSGVRLSA